MIKLKLVAVNRQSPYRRSSTEFPWKTCAPFLDNPRAKLIHRPRAVSTYTHHKTPYIGVTAWCGSSFNGDDLTFHDIPPEGKLLCARCEATAIQNKFPSADELAGKHIHQGRMIAIQTCHVDRFGDE